MKLPAILAGTAIAAVMAATAPWDTVSADPDTAYTPQFTADGELLLPSDQIWREWIYVGAPLTPNALNGGEAGFPEFHSVYVEPRTWQHYKQTGAFMDGAVLAKELSLVQTSPDGHPDGSTDEASGRGYFMGEYAGFEILYKSRDRFPDAPGNWAFFTFGHHAPPYADTAQVMPEDACSGCHQAAAEQDLVFTQFYPVLQAARP